MNYEFLPDKRYASRKLRIKGYFFPLLGITSLCFVFIILPKYCSENNLRSSDGLEYQEKSNLEVPLSCYIKSLPIQAEKPEINGTLTTSAFADYWTISSSATASTVSQYRFY